MKLSSTEWYSIEVAIRQGDMGVRGKDTFIYKCPVTGKNKGTP